MRRDPRIDGRRLVCGLDTKRILMVVTGFERRCAQMDDRVVTLDLLIKSSANGGGKVTNSGPISASVNCASIAQDNRWILGIRSAFELALNVKDRPLRSLPDFRRTIARESPTE